MKTHQEIDDSVGVSEWTIKLKTEIKISNRAGEKSLKSCTPDAEVSKKLIGCYVHPEFHHEVRNAANGRGMSISDIIRRALELHLTVESTP